MRKGIFFTVFSLLAVIACRETETKTVVREVETTQEEKGALERTAERVDNEVDEKVDEQIDRIGDDN
ncbi:hypothetical protein [Flavimarina sp. Hel_I_48]|uniref:hypothetical protein n=1 Tax=Flavimarina sp. Hel_I_48 TaxID=1392488 RepID=UPI0004DF2EA5|nr:hypothetical protein [Flavimarina sp. Hel_I_48]